jgi:8-oxo-dGTP pyrophosphatase MutT (NUDIX family)
MSLPMKSGPVSIGDELIPPPVPVNRGQGAQRVASPIDRLFQGGYFLAYRLLRAWWFLRRPKHQGAVVALWHRGRILMVHSSYRARWDLPGGGVGRGEDARIAALRELREELGLTLTEDALTLVQAEEIFFEYRYDHVSVFEAELREPPAIRIDNREIVAAEFRAPAAIDRSTVSDYFARYLAGHGAARAAALTQSSPPASA